MADFTLQEIEARWRFGCIVSCQALEDEPLHGSHLMAAMARAAEIGGAAGIRANSPQDIRAIKAVCRLPVIGLYKKEYPESDVWITPALKEVRQVAEAGADLIAIDATGRARPGGETFEGIVRALREEYPRVLVFADVSTYEEGVRAMEAGADFVSTAIAGYTPYSRASDEPDYELVRALASLRRTPVVAEGRIWTPEQGRRCLEEGAFAIVVGSAITRPSLITNRFVRGITEGTSS